MNMPPLRWDPAYLPQLIPYNQLRRDPVVQALAEAEFGGTEVHNVFHLVTLMCMPVFPEETVTDHTALLGGCLFYAPPLMEGGTTITELWTLGVGVGASAVWTFEKFGTGVCVHNESDTEPFHRRTLELLERSTWLVLRTPAQVAGLMGMAEPATAS